MSLEPLHGLSYSAPSAWISTQLSGSKSEQTLKASTSLTSQPSGNRSGCNGENLCRRLTKLCCALIEQEHRGHPLAGMVTNSITSFPQSTVVTFATNPDALLLICGLT